MLVNSFSLVKTQQELLTPTGSLGKLGFWAMTECYVVIIVASIPLLNSLIKRSKAIGREGSIDAEKLSNQQSET
jgi:hypothetical protein